MIMAVVTELITKFGFEGSTAPLNNYNKSLGSSIKLMAKMSAVGAAAFSAMSAWASSILAAEQPLIDLSAKTGVAIERIQELQFIAGQNSSSSGAITSTLEGMAERIGEAARKGGEAGEAFQMLGINIKDANGNIKESDKILMEIGGRFDDLKLSMSEKQFFAKRLGIDTSLLTMMSKTSEEMRIMSEEANKLGVLTSEQVGQATKYNDTLGRLKFRMEGIKRLVAVGLAPQLERMAESFSELLLNNKDWIVNGIKKTVEFLGDLVRMFVRITPMLTIAAGGFAALKIMTMGWATAVGFLSKALKVSGIFLFLGIMDEVITTFKGGKTILGDFGQYLSNEFPKFFDSIFDGFKTVWDDMKKMFKWIEDKLKMLTDSMKTLGQELKDILGIGSEEAEERVKQEKAKELAGLVANNRINRSGGASGMIELINLRNQGMISQSQFDAVQSGELNRGDLLNSGGQSLMTSGMDDRRSSSTTINQNVKMEVRTTDPVKAGEVASDRLQNQIDNAAQQGSSSRGGR